MDVPHAMHRVRYILILTSVRKMQISRSHSVFHISTYLSPTRIPTYVVPLVEQLLALYSGNSGRRQRPESSTWQEFACGACNLKSRVRVAVDIGGSEPVSGATWNMMMLGAAIFLVVVLDSLNASLMGFESERDD